MVPTTINLLDHLAGLAQCGYISNLRFIHAPSACVWAAVEQTPAKAYPRQAWLDALHYLTGQTPSADTAQQCRQFLMDYFSPNNSK